MHELLASLNDRQREAAQTTAGPVLILAGAGSGKTKTLIHRIAYLIATNQAKPYNILAVTFTNKASKEMKARLQRLLAGKVTQWPIMGTFHSVCVQILRREITALDYDSRFVIYDDADTMNLIKKVMKDLRIDTKAVAPTGIRYLISKAKNELYTPEHYEAEAGDTLERTAAQVYVQYQAELKRNAALDFDDLIRLTVKIFQEHPDVLKKYQEAFHYILVDEYQDTNHAQYVLINLLAKTHQNLCVVGDDFQCVTPETKIRIPGGWKEAQDLQVGDTIISGSGRGKTMMTQVIKKHVQKIKTELYNIKTKQGHHLQLTANHIVFAHLGDAVSHYYVYLMYKQTVGYRIGMAKGQRFTHDGQYQPGLMVRGNQERADKMWILRICLTKTQAQYWEMFLAFKYGIPTTVFTADNLRSMSIAEVKALFQNIDTRERVKKLCSDLHLNLQFPHYRPSGTTRFKTERKVLRLDWFADSRRTIQSPWNATRIALHTTNQKLKRILLHAGYSARKSKKDTWRLELSRLRIADAEEEAKKIYSILSDVELIRSAWLTDAAKMLLLPASHLHPTMVIPVLSENNIIEDEIIAVKRMPYVGKVIDFDVDTTHNYCANGIIVHNSIYSWRGANIQNILDFEEDYPKAKVVLLEQNYRSTKSILTAANEIIKYNVKQKEKTLWTDNDHGHKIVIKAVADEQAEGAYIIREIFMPQDSQPSESDEIKYIDEENNSADEVDIPAKTNMLDRIMRSGSFQGYQADQQLLDRIRQQLRLIDLTHYVILYRTNAQSRALEEAFLKYHVPYRIVGGLKFYERKEIKDLIAYIRIVANPNDWVSLERIVNVPARGLGMNTWHKIENACRDLNKNILDVDLAELPITRPQQQESFGRFQAMLRKLHTTVAKRTPSEIVDLIIRQTQFKDQFNTKLPEDMSRLENVEELKSVTKSYDHLLGHDGLLAFLEEITLASDQDDLDEKNNAVNMMTIHAAKGLEFDTVFIGGMEEGLFPHARSLFQPSEMEEERRLCYVALTRAKRRAYFIYAEQRTVFGHTQITAPSRFLNDIPKQLIDWQ